MKKMIALAEDLVPKMVDVKEKEIGDLVDNEMASTTSAIEEAARRIAVSLFSLFCSADSSPLLSKSL